MNRQNPIRAGIVITACLFLFSCAVSTEDGDSSSSKTELIDSAQITRDVKDSAPVYVNLKLKLKSGAIPVIGTLHHVFKDFDITRPDETSAQEVDEQNIYVASYKNLNYLEQIAENNPITEFSGTKTVNPTYPGLEGQNVTYRMGGSGQMNWTAPQGFRYTGTWAGNIDGDQIEAILAMTEKGDKDPGDSRQIVMNRNIYLKQNLTTGDILMDIAYSVDHEWEGGGLYAPRLWLDGNRNTHSFRIRGGQYGWYQPTAQPVYNTCITYIAAGSDNSNDYMIAYIEQLTWEGTNNNPSTNSPGVNRTTGSGYYKIPAMSDYSNMIALTVYDTLEELITAETDPNGYGTDLQTLVPFTYHDLPHGAASFTNANSLY